MCMWYVWWLKDCYFVYFVELFIWVIEAGNLSIKLLGIWFVVKWRKEAMLTLVVTYVHMVCLVEKLLICVYWWIFDLNYWTANMSIKLVGILLVVKWGKEAMLTLLVTCVHMVCLVATYKIANLCILLKFLIWIIEAGNMNIKLLGIWFVVKWGKEAMLTLVVTYCKIANLCILLNFFFSYKDFIKSLNSSVCIIKAANMSINLLGIWLVVKWGKETIVTLEVIRVLPF